MSCPHVQMLVVYGVETDTYLLFQAMQLEEEEEEAVFISVVNTNELLNTGLCSA